MAIECGAPVAARRDCPKTKREVVGVPLPVVATEVRRTGHEHVGGPCFPLARLPGALLADVVVRPAQTNRAFRALDQLRGGRIGGQTIATASVQHSPTAMIGLCPSSALAGSAEGSGSFAVQPLAALPETRTPGRGRRPAPDLRGRQRTSGRAGTSAVRRWALGNQVPNDRRGLAASLEERLRRVIYSTDEIDKASSIRCMNSVLPAATVLTRVPWGVPASISRTVVDRYARPAQRQPTPGRVRSSSYRLQQIPCVSCVAPAYPTATPRRAACAWSGPDDPTRTAHCA